MQLCEWQAGPVAQGRIRGALECDPCARPSVHHTRLPGRKFSLSNVMQIRTIVMF
jgi:hypothetical protein